MTMNRRRFSPMAAGAAARWAASARPARAGRHALVLAQSAPFTGPAAQLGIQFHQGAKLYFDHLQRPAGRRATPVIELTRLDDGYEPDRCAANTRS
jgi:branched-chain amino acid transport system substrate-binding protein